MFAFAILAVLMMQDAPTSAYGNAVAELPVVSAKKLAEANKPNESGAIGRNRKAYFHVRFQLGMHHVADYGLATQNTDVINRFLTASEYSLEFQKPSGDFQLMVPEALKAQGKPNAANRASGVAFFASSLGMGLHALETNDWFMQSPECQRQRQRLAAIKPKLSKTLSYLIQHREHLEAIDKLAPNRLLFDALALVTLGKLLKDEAALEVGSEFIEKACGQIDEREGYFIEGGGFDSSYNAVATALAFRLWMLNRDDRQLKSVCAKAISWQKERVLPTGEISTEGNARVRPGESGESGESFLGRKKDVDVAHAVEAFMLASKALSDPQLNDLALAIANHYENSSMRGSDAQ